MPLPHDDAGRLCAIMTDDPRDIGAEGPASGGIPAMPEMKMPEIPGMPSWLGGYCCAQKSLDCLEAKAYLVVCL